MIDWNKHIPLPYDHFLAILATVLVFVFLVGLYADIFFLGRIEAEVARLAKEEAGG